MIAPKYRITNRHERRLFNREAEKALQPLMKTEQLFFDLLFDDTIAFSYQSIYHLLRDVYQTEVEKLQARGFKYIDIVPDYFDNKYKPLEYGHRL